MSTPFYVSPQQAMADKAEYARKGIARGRSVVVLTYSTGILFVAENPSRALHKVSEIYDRIAFAAVGKYNEFENLRMAGVRYADLRGYQFDRTDVTARGLSNLYAQALGTIFSSAAEKPYEVELIIAEVGEGPADDQIYRLTHDGSVVDEQGSVAMGGNSEQIGSYLEQRHEEGMALSTALRLAVDALSRDGNGGGRTLTSDQLEVAMLNRERTQKRKFQRLLGDRLHRLLDSETSESSTGGDGDGEAETPSGEAAESPSQRSTGDGVADGAGSTDDTSGSDNSGKPTQDS